MSEGMKPDIHLPIMVLGILVIAVGSALIRYGNEKIEQEQLARSKCLPVAATVISVSRIGRPGSRGVDRPVIKYKYNVDGREFISDRTTYEEIYGDTSWVDGICAKYSPGSKATAFYDPADPSFSFLTMVAADRFGGVISAGKIVFAIGALMAVGNPFILGWRIVRWLIQMVAASSR